MKLNLPITVAGPENNRIFFEHHNDLLDYEKLEEINLLDVYEALKLENDNIIEYKLA